MPCAPKQLVAVNDSEANRRQEQRSRIGCEKQGLHDVPCCLGREVKRMGWAGLNQRLCSVASFIKSSR